MRGAGTASTAAQHASGGCSLHFSHQQHSAHARQVQRQPSPVAAAHAARAPQRQRRRHLAVVAAAGGRDPRHKNMSRVEVFMRTTPPLNMFVDYKLLLGDVVMVLATETASDRIPLDQMPQLTASLVAAWLFAGALRGDYRMEDDPDNNNPLANAMGWPILIAIIGAAETWGCTMPPAILGYAFMVSGLGTLAVSG